jgi:hypothetical protein
MPVEAVQITHSQLIEHFLAAVLLPGCASCGHWFAGRTSRKADSRDRIGGSPHPVLGGTLSFTSFYSLSNRRESPSQDQTYKYFDS